MFFIPSSCHRAIICIYMHRNHQNWTDGNSLPIELYQKAGKMAPTIKESDAIERLKEISAPNNWQEPFIYLFQIII